MSERRLFNKYFGKMFKDKYLILWCEMCETCIISHEKCGGTTCNCGGRDECLVDFTEFGTFKIRIDEYLSKEELAIYEKALRIKKFILKAVELGDKEIDFEKMARFGHMSESDYGIFNIPKEWKYKG